MSSGQGRITLNIIFSYFETVEERKDEIIECPLKISCHGTFRKKTAMAGSFRRSGTRRRNGRQLTQKINQT
jgi:hypothetical protein